MSNAALSLLTAALVLLTGAESLLAQQNRTPTRVPVTVVLMDELPVPDAPAVLMRRADVAPHDLILLRADAANGKELSSAIVDLITMREQFGDTASTTGIMRIRPKNGPPGQTRRQFPWAQRVVVDLRKAEMREIPGVGTVQAVEIWLPPQRQGGKRP